MKILFTLFFLFLGLTSFSQDLSVLSNKADSLYNAGKYSEAAPIYRKIGQMTQFKLNKRDMYYNAACCLALVGSTKDALIVLDSAVTVLDYSNVNHMKKDTDLNSIKGTNEFKKLVEFIEKKRPSRSNNIEDVKLVTTDITNFWNAYDKVQNEPGKITEIYRSEYFGKASPGLEDYLALRIGSVENFSANQKKNEKYYAGIRKNTENINEQTKLIYSSFYKLKEIYSDAVFPDVYFLIGRLNSAGTTSDNGLLIGLDQMAYSEDVDISGFSESKRQMLKHTSVLPNIVAHELIHYQQDKMNQSQTLLGQVIREGMADFIAELISGRSLNFDLDNYTKGKEKELYDLFFSEMDSANYRNWLFNYGEDRRGKPADLGYWLGREICRSYYENQSDKKQAIIDMLSIQNYREFLNKSKYAEKIKK